MIKKTHGMTYSQYRNSFNDQGGFLQAFGALTYEQAHDLADREYAPIFVKARIMDTWRKAKEKGEHKEYE